MAHADAAVDSQAGGAVGAAGVADDGALGDAALEEGVLELALGVHDGVRRRAGGRSAVAGEVRDEDARVRLEEAGDSTERSRIGRGAVKDDDARSGSAFVDVHGAPLGEADVLALATGVAPG